MKTSWDDRYSLKEYVYGKEPNAFFREQLEQLKPGLLLLPAEGEGRNAVFAARSGWEVTAFDQSEAGKTKALSLAKEHDVSIRYAVGNASTIELPPDYFDAVGLVFAHFPSAERRSIHRRFIRSLKPNGIIILEGFTVRQIAYQERYHSGGPRDQDSLYTPAIVTELLEGCEIELLKEEEVQLQEGNFHNGLASVIRCVARKL